MNRNRMHSRSNQGLQRLISAIDSTHCPSSNHSRSNTQNIISHELQDKQLYKQSYKKIHRIKSILIRNSSKQLMEELNDVIDLIKGERVKAKFTIEELCKVAQRVQEERSRFREVGVNTDDMILGGVIQSIDACSQTFECEQVRQEQSKPEQKLDIENTRKYESYYKIVCMIDNLKVDYRQILPILPNLPAKYILPDVDSKKDTYKILKSEQIVKLQRVFISKIKSMITNEQTKRKKSETISTSFQTPKKNIIHLVQPETAVSLSKENQTARFGSQ